jgi:hypothetical protein
MQFVNNLNCLVPKSTFVLLPVVAAEVQFTAARQDCANIGLGSTAITSICRRECRLRQSRAHPLTFRRCLNPVSNSVPWNRVGVRATPWHFAQGVCLFTNAHAAWGPGFGISLT